MGEANSPFSRKNLVIIAFVVNKLLIASSVALSSSRKKRIAKFSKHDGAFSTISNFGPKTLSYMYLVPL